MIVSIPYSVTTKNLEIVIQPKTIHVLPPLPCYFYLKQRQSLLYFNSMFIEMTIKIHVSSHYALFPIKMQNSIKEFKCGQDTYS
jgi:hypothetical protein